MYFCVSMYERRLYINCQAAVIATDIYERLTQEKLEGWRSDEFIRRGVFWRGSDCLRENIEAKHGNFVLFPDLAVCRIGRHIS